MKRYLPFVIIAVVLIAAVAAGWLLTRSSQPHELAIATPAPAASGSPSAAPTEEKKFVLKTDKPKSVVVIEEYGDYQCPPCGFLHPLVKGLKSEFGERVQVKFYHLPLTQVHKNAQDAALAAEAAKQQGKFWEMHNKLYESQQVWSELTDIRPVVADFARQLGLEVERFKRDMDGSRAAAVVAADVQRAASLGINSTPTLVIEGQTFPNDKISADNLRKVVTAVLQGHP